MGGVYLLEYGAGNVRSVVNAVKKLGYDLQAIETPDDFFKADKLIFPGVGSFGAAMTLMEEKGFIQPLLAYLASGRPFFGVCVGMQSLFAESEESPGVKGLGLLPAMVRKFSDKDKAVPHMGWNGVHVFPGHPPFLNQDGPNTKYYFVHSYAVFRSEVPDEWIMSTTTYGDQEFVSSIHHGNIFATQFHPEKSGNSGIKVFEAFLKYDPSALAPVVPSNGVTPGGRTQFTKRIIACLDVRANDNGDLVVTKGDQYDVREKDSGDVRNLGKPVDLARRYFNEGADEITFLNITSFRNSPLADLPMLEVLRRTSESVFVPLTIGGGIRDYKDPDGKTYSALEVAALYFRSGADKVSIGSDAVFAVEDYLRNGASGNSSIEQIARVYGSQAVVISVDPRRVYVNSPSDTHHAVLKTPYTGPNGEQYCWYQCTVAGGREGRDIDVIQLVTACEALGAGEILLNCMDQDGRNSGYDLQLVEAVKRVVHIPVIASSGAGRVEHFSDVFARTGVESALAAGIFHRREVPIQAVKDYLQGQGVPVRTSV